jgi:hypothetical protein
MAVDAASRLRCGGTWRSTAWRRRRGPRARTWPCWWLGALTLHSVGLCGSKGDVLTACDCCTCGECQALWGRVCARGRGREHLVLRLLCAARWLSLSVDECAVLVADDWHCRAVDARRKGGESVPEAAQAGRRTEYLAYWWNERCERGCGRPAPVYGARACSGRRGGRV